MWLYMLYTPYSPFMCKSPLYVHPIWCVCSLHVHLPLRATLFHVYLFTYVSVLNRLLKRPVDSMGRARLLDKIPSMGQAHLLDKKSSKRE